MIRTLIAFLAKLILLLATTVFVIFLSLFVAASFFLTWPVLRLSPRDRRIKAGMDLAQSAMTVLTIYSGGSIKRAMEQATETDDHVLDEFREWVLNRELTAEDVVSLVFAQIGIDSPEDDTDRYTDR